MKELCFYPDYVAGLKRLRPPGSMMVPYSIIATVLAAIVIASIARIEVITSASGKIIPSGKVKLIRAAETGTVASLEVADGQTVAAGDLLMVIDDRNLRADLMATEKEQASIASRLNLLRLAAGLDLSTLQSLAEPKLIERLQREPKTEPLHRQWMSHRLQGIRDRLAAVERQQQEAVLEQQLARTRLEKLQKIEPLVRERLQANNKLAKRGFTSRVAQQQQQIDWLDTRYSLREQHQQLDLLQQRIDMLKQQLPELYRQFQLQIADELHTFDLKLRGLNDRISSLHASLDNTRILSPIAGVVENLNVTSAGLYVKTGEPLLSIVPASDQPIAEVRIPSREAGFLRIGHYARIKVDAFPFTRYGSLPATLVYLSQDATTETDGSELVYIGHLKLQQAHFDVRGETQPVQIGMSLQGDIISDERRLIDFFVAPIKQTLMDAMKER